MQNSIWFLAFVILTLRPTRLLELSCNSSHICPNLRSNTRCIIQPKHINAVRIWYSAAFETGLESSGSNMALTAGRMGQGTKTKRHKNTFLFKLY